jgi:hypothetical protein
MSIQSFGLERVRDILAQYLGVKLVVEANDDPGLSVTVRFLHGLLKAGAKDG